MGGQKPSNTWTPTKRRGPIAAEFSTPGPAAIGLPSTFGANISVKTRAPSFTISGRHEIKHDSAGPGPGQYNINGLSYKGKDEPTAPSMHIRPKDPRQFVTPAPGDYCPEKSKKVLDQAPKFSFGIKPDNNKGPEVPAPNSYNIPSLIGSAKPTAVHQQSPSFTMSGRPRDEEDKMKIPGPGTYNEAIVDKYKTVKSPAFSMGQRTNIPSDHTRKPGPGAHSPEKCFQDDGPKFSMGIRLNEVHKLDVPGPGSYNAGELDYFLEKSPVYTMRPRTELLTDKSPKPSPNAYCPEKYVADEGPKFTMGGRYKDVNTSDVPGPGTYQQGNLNSILEKKPAFTMSLRTEIPFDKTPKPAPNAYSPEKTMRRETPEFSFGVKHSQYLGKLRDQ